MTADVIRVCCGNIGGSRVAIRQVDPWRKVLNAGLAVRECDGSVDIFTDFAVPRRASGVCGHTSVDITVKVSAFASPDA